MLPSSPHLCPPPRDPRQQQASRFVSRALGVAGLCLFLVGAGTSQRVRPEQLAPQTDIEIEALPLAEPVVPTRACAGPRDIRAEKGTIPALAHITHRLVWRSQSSLPLSYAEKELAAAARQQCGDGLSLQRAIADDGAAGVVEVHAVVWRLPTPSPPPP